MRLSTQERALSFATLAEMVLWLGATVYGGSLAAWAVLLGLLPRLRGVDTAQAMRLFRAWGAGFGLSMGATFLGLVATHHLRHGGFHAPHGPELAAELVFLVLWASSFHLEIWTLEPCRRLDGPEGVSDRAAMEAASRRVARQLAANLVLFVAAGLLLLAS